MSVKELRLEDGYGRMLHITTFAGVIAVTPIIKIIGDTIALDRNQAHLLMLYLQEHLGYISAPISDDKQNPYWYCKACRTLHKKDYVCESLQHAEANLK